MRLLGISCDANGIEVAAGLLNAGPGTGIPGFDALVSVRREGGASVSDLAMALVEEVLASFARTLPAGADTTHEAIDAIVFNAGPGGFTSVRTACAMAQGLAFGWNKPVVPVSSLASWAEPLLPEAVTATGGTQAAETLVLLDARMGELYCGLFSLPAGTAPAGWQQRAEGVLSPSALDSWLDEHAPCTGGDRSLLCSRFLTGDARLACPEVVARLVNAGWIDRMDARLQVQAMFSSVWRKGPAVFQDAALAGPHYVRDKVALNSTEQQALRDLNARPGPVMQG